MPKTLTVNNTDFLYPIAGEDPGWGEEATGWAEEVTDVLSDLQTPGDILQSTFGIPLSGSGDVNGLLLGTSVVRSAKIDYSLYRISTASPSGTVETGTMIAVYDNAAGSGSKWILTHQYQGNAYVTFDITDAGQVTYVSDAGPHSAPGYSGIMKFRAKALNQ